ncbi:hypothetical protein PROFUN_07665 [Planoprotostelium fungivorum]|uniref:Uncharacterized protein n=1 Tax=Planoprotostelium fungivorum TaxID=1890364 RepID=A0A2P6MM32_9EUKA|nr:hypothetical protein PROFUN_07665 [Planoprotostelium fungivorum]
MEEANPLGDIAIETGVSRDHEQRRQNGPTFEKREHSEKKEPAVRTPSVMKPFVLPNDPQPDGADMHESLLELMKETDVPKMQKVIDALEILLPPAKEEMRLYHTPRSDMSRLEASSIVLSIEPNDGVYDLMSQRRQADLTFLHRPFNLNRRNVPRTSSVTSSHIRFDELLTTGWNPILALRLGMANDVFCVQGFKNDPDRKIGLIGKLKTPVSRRQFHDQVEREFEGIEVAQMGNEEEEKEMVHTVGILNALTPDLLRDIESECKEYKVDMLITGAPREVGLLEASKIGFSVLAVGHTSSEWWGIKELRNILARLFTGAKIHVVEPEMEETNEKISYTDENGIEYVMDEGKKQKRTRRGNSARRNNEKSSSSRGKEETRGDSQRGRREEKNVGSPEAKHETKKRRESRGRDNGRETGKSEGFKSKPMNPQAAVFGGKPSVVDAK